MGRSYWYECPRCGYRARVSGRADRGLNLFVQTVVCRDCKELFDAVTRFKVPDESELGLSRNGFGLWRRLPTWQRYRRNPPSFQMAVNQLPYAGAKHFKWLHYKPQCPVSVLHRVEGWNEPDKCPKCATYVEKNVLPYRIWE